MLACCAPQAASWDLDCSPALAESAGATMWDSVAQIEVSAMTEADFRTWDGWVHSRLRQLVMRVEPFVLVR